MGVTPVPKPPPPRTTKDCPFSGAPCGKNCAIYSVKEASHVDGEPCPIVRISDRLLSISMDMILRGGGPDA